MAKEDTIRDKLSATLDVIEPGLELLETEHRLPNDAGAGGRVDILAKDSLGNLVIIELKRSDQAARAALFEILKYMPLFRHYHNVPAHRIRCIIVSTTWHELLVPFSEFRRLCETQTEGFRIDVDGEGNVLRAARMTDEAENPAAHPFRIHSAFLLKSSAERDDAIPIVKEAFSKAGAEGYLLLKINYKGPSANVIYPFGAYFVPTLIERQVRDNLTKNAVDALEGDDDDFFDESVEHSVQDNFLGLVGELLVGLMSSKDMEVSVQSSEGFVKVLHNGWQVDSIERVGSHASQLVLPDNEVIELIKGSAGDNFVRYERLSSPRNRLDWENTKSRAETCLRGNAAWQHGFNWFVEHVEQAFPDGVVRIMIYNPQLLPESLYMCAMERTSDYLPEIAVFASSNDGTKSEVLVGSIIWDGKRVPQSVDAVFSDGVCDGLSQFYFWKTIGVAWDLDAELMRRHGLEYSLWWLTFDNNNTEVAKRMVVAENGTIEEASVDIAPNSLAAYFDTTRPYLEELFSEIDNHVTRVS